MNRTILNGSLAFAILTCAASCDDSQEKKQELPDPVTVEIPPEGGTVSIPGFADLVVPAGTLDVEQSLTVAITSSTEVDALFLATAYVSGGFDRAPYALRICVSTSAPIGPIAVTLNLPNAFSSEIPPGSAIRAFGKYTSAGDDEFLESFDLYPAEARIGDPNLVVAVPPWRFNPTSEGFEAILVIGATANATPNGEAGQLSAAGNPLGLCLGSLSGLTSPMNGDIRQQCLIRDGVVLVPCTTGNVSSQYGPRSRVGAGPLHRGVDLFGIPGDPVRAAMGGVVDVIGTQTRAGVPVGWKQFVKIRHANGTDTLGYTQYAEITPAPDLKVNASVTSNTIIGTINDSFHVHFELYDSRNVLINPYPCFSGVDEMTIFGGPGVWDAKYQGQGDFNRSNVCEAEFAQSWTFDVTATFAFPNDWATQPTFVKATATGTSNTVRVTSSPTCVNDDPIPYTLVTTQVLAIDTGTTSCFGRVRDIAPDRVEFDPDARCSEPAITQHSTKTFVNGDVEEDTRESFLNSVWRDVTDRRLANLVASRPFVEFNPSQLLAVQPYEDTSGCTDDSGRSVIIQWLDSPLRILWRDRCVKDPSRPVIPEQGLITSSGTWTRREWVWHPLLVP